MELETEMEMELEMETINSVCCLDLLGGGHSYIVHFIPACMLRRKIRLISTL